MAGVAGGSLRVEKRRFIFIFPAGNALMAVTEQKMRSQRTG
jgi:hypothetical protein